MLRTRILALALPLYTLLGGIYSLSLAASPSDALLPNTTRGFLSVTNVPTLEEHWDKTQLGQLAKDPVMKPFVDDLRAQLEDRWSDLHDRLGVTTQDLHDVASGELTIAAVQLADGTPAAAVIVDVTGTLPKAKALLAKIAKNLVAQKAEHKQEQMEGVSVEVFNLAPEEASRLPSEFSPSPKGPAVPAAKAKERKRKPKSRSPRSRPTGSPSTVCGRTCSSASSHRSVIQGILARAAGKKAPTLADDRAYQAVMKRCGDDAGKAVPQIRWYVQPQGYLEFMRSGPASKPSPTRRGTTSPSSSRSRGLTPSRGWAGSWTSASSTMRRSTAPRCTPRASTSSR